jgi:hypothetical protein
MESDRGIKDLLKFDAGRKFLYMAADLKPGTPIMDDVAAKAAAAAARSLVKTQTSICRPDWNIGYTVSIRVQQRFFGRVCKRAPRWRTGPIHRQDGRFRISGFLLFFSSQFHDGLCLVTTENEIGYINRQGEFVWRGPYVETQIGFDSRF